VPLRDPLGILSSKVKLCRLTRSWPVNLNEFKKLTHLELEGGVVLVPELVAHSVWADLFSTDLQSLVLKPHFIAAAVSKKLREDTVAGENSFEFFRQRPQDNLRASQVKRHFPAVQSVHLASAMVDLGD
jgi:hypothetical protein